MALTNNRPMAVDSPKPASRRRFAGMQELGLIGVIVLLGALLAVLGGNTQTRITDPETSKQYLVTKNKFLNVDRLLKLAKDTSFFAIMAIGATMVIVIGGVDLSVIVAASAICLGVGALCWAINGLGVISLGLHPFIITLGTLSIFRGIAFVTTQAQSIGQFSPAFVSGFISYPLKIGANESIYPIPLCILIAITLWGTYYLSMTVTGRKLYAIGGNELAARYAGLPVERLKATTYVLAGLMAGIAAMINIGYYGSAASSDGAGYELDVIAAAVVGGASLSGGRGTALGAVLGALVIRMIDAGIVILDLDQNYSRIIVGSVIILAAALDRVQARWRAKRG
jgi:ribose/xylose/arabinose/galactoside ABC-type transport system permease subunit